MDIMKIINEYVELRYEYESHEYYVNISDRYPDREGLKEFANRAQVEMDRIKPLLDAKFEEYEKSVLLLSKDELKELRNKIDAICESLVAKTNILHVRKIDLTSNRGKLTEDEEIELKEIELDLKKLGNTVHIYGFIFYNLGKRIGFGSR